MLFQRYKKKNNIILYKIIFIAYFDLHSYIIAMMKNIIFDLGGVLIDWNPYLAYKDRFTLQEYEEFIKFISPFNELCDAGCSFNTMRNYLNVIYPEKKEKTDLWFDAWNLMLVGVKKDTLEVFNLLKDKGASLYCISNWSKENFPQADGDYKFLESFLDIVVSGYVQLIKPGKEIFELFLKRNNLKAKDCIFIDDRKDNIETSKLLGMDGIVFTDAKTLKEDLQKRNLLY